MPFTTYDEMGNAGLPLPVLTMPDGNVLKGIESRDALSVRQAFQLDPATMAVPRVKYPELLIAAANMSPLHPVNNPPT